MLVLCSFLSLHAQRLMINPSVCQSEDLQQAGIEAILEPGTKAVKKAIKDWMDDNYDIKLKGLGLFTNKDVLTAEQVRIDAISDKQMDFKVQVIEEGNNTKMCVFGSYGYDFPISPTEYPLAYQKMRGITLDFLDSFVPKWYADRIDESQEVLADLQKERKNLEKDIRKNEKEIEKLQEENVEKAETLTKTAAELKKTAATLEIQKKKLKEVNEKLDDKKGNNQ